MCIYHFSNNGDLIVTKGVTNVICAKQRPVNRRKTVISSFLIAGIHLAIHFGRFSYYYAVDIELHTTHTLKNRPKTMSKLQEMYRGPQKRVHNRKLFYDFSTKTYVVGTQKNRLDETVLLTTQNTCFNGWVRNKSQFYAKKFA